MVLGAWACGCERPKPGRQAAAFGRSLNLPSLDRTHPKPNFMITPVLDHLLGGELCWYVHPSLSSVSFQPRQRICRCTLLTVVRGGPGVIITILGFFFILIDRPNDLFAIDTPTLDASRKWIQVLSHPLLLLKAGDGVTCY